LGFVPQDHGGGIGRRRLSVAFKWAVRQLADGSGVFTVADRLRAAAGHTARHNTIFQGLAADGAKLALWRLWRACYRIVNFVHDQVLVEVPDRWDLEVHVGTIRRLMIVGMSEVIHTVRIEVALTVKRRWHEDAGDPLLPVHKSALHRFRTRPRLALLAALPVPIRN